MLYIFDLGNVIVDIDFNRVFGAWSDFSRVPLATLKQNFVMGEAFHQHERGEITDEAFAQALCHEMDLSLSYEQFAHGWQAIFVGLRPDVIAIMHKLREQGHRVVVLSNTNRPSGRMNSLKCALRLTISIFRKKWVCVNRKREFISGFWKRKVSPPTIRSFSTITPIILKAPTNWGSPAFW